MPQLTEERIAKLNEENAPYDEISRAMNSLDLSKSFYEHFKELQERLDKIKAKNPMDDPAIKAAYEKQTKLQNRVN